MGICKDCAHSKKSGRWYFCNLKGRFFPYNKKECDNYKKKSNMKELIKSWKFWVAIAAAVLIIVAVVLFFTVPKFAQVIGGGLVGLIIGFALGCFLCKKNILCKKEE